MTVPVPSIGSDAWDAELAETGVTRAAVEALLAQAFGGREPGSLSPEELEAVGIDPSDALEVEGAEGPLAAALRGAGVLDAAGGVGEAAGFVLAAAAELLLDERGPRRGDRWHLVGFGLGALPLDEPRAWRWYARQLAALVARGDEVLRAEMIDRFRFGSSLSRAALADALFPWLAEALPDSLHPWLMAASGAVSWSVKRALCERLAPIMFGATAAPDIDSQAWSGELSLMGVAEDEVEALYLDLFSDRRPGEVWNHDVFRQPDPVYGRAGGRLESLLSQRGRFDKFREDVDSPERVVLQAAVLFLAFWRWPLHADLDYVRVCAWRPGDAPRSCTPLVRRWLSRQLAACLRYTWDDGDDTSPSVEHVIDQFFGFTEIDPVLFPWLVADLPAEVHPALLACSATVAWRGKRDFYASFARDPANHERLADALARSCRSDVFHSIDAREGLALLEQLHALDAERCNELRSALTAPLAAVVVAVAEPAESIFRTEHAGRSFIALALESDLLMWLMDADLWLDEECFGPLATWAHGAWPEGPTTGREGLSRDGASKPVPVLRRQDMVAPVPSETKGSPAWHGIDVSYERALGLVGRRVEFRPRLG